MKILLTVILTMSVILILGFCNLDLYLNDGYRFINLIAVIMNFSLAVWFYCIIAKKAIGGKR